jgi:hypothetical protein
MPWDWGKGKAFRIQPDVMVAAVMMQKAAASP